MRRVEGSAAEPVVHYLALHYEGTVHHHRHSGYQRLPQFVDLPWSLGAAGPKSDTEWSRFAMRADPWRWLRQPFLATRVMPAGWNFNLDMDGIRSPAPLVHYLYGEETYFLAGMFRRPNSVVTLHQPFDLLRRKLPFGHRRYLARARKILAMSRQQADQLRRHLPGADIEFTYHGLDTEYFAPATKERDDVLLFTGGYLRDFETLVRVLRRVLPRVRGMKAIIVAPIVFAHKFLPAFDRLRQEFGERFQFLHGISDDELRHLYQRARLYFSPLLDATANNGIIEALGCGLPVVATDVGGVPDYLEPSGVGVGEADRMADQIERLWDETKELRARGERNRRFAVQHLSWPIVGKQMTREYKRILDDGKP